MPECLSSTELLEIAVEEKVAFVPGNAFYPDGEDGHCCMRLNFSYSSPEIIEEGIKRLGRAIQRMMDEADPEG
jgi:2-aminoadipate transaminase